jgi:hypothetical protein
LLSERIHLERIQSILNYKIHFLIFSIGMVFYPSLGLPVIYLIMIAFVPYLIFVLFKFKKYFWIVLLFILVLLPLLNQPFGFLGFKLTEQLTYLPLFFFLLLMFILKLVSRDWLEDLNAKIFRKYKTDVPI